MIEFKLAKINYKKLSDLLLKLPRSSSEFSESNQHLYNWKTTNSCMGVLNHYNLSYALMNEENYPFFIDKRTRDYKLASRGICNHDYDSFIESNLKEKGYSYDS